MSGIQEHDTSNKQKINESRKKLGLEDETEIKS